MFATTFCSPTAGGLSSENASAAQGSPHAALRRLLLCTRVADSVHNASCIVSEQDGAIRSFRTVEWTTKRLVILIEALDDWEQPIRLSGFLVKEETVNRVTCTEGGSASVAMVRNKGIGVVVCRETRQ